MVLAEKILPSSLEGSKIQNDLRLNSIHEHLVYHFMRHHWDA